MCSWACRIGLSLVAVLLLAAAAAARSDDQPGQTDAALARIDTLIQQARDSGVQYLNTNDHKARDAAHKSLDAAERAVRDLLKHDAACERGLEFQAAIPLFRATFKIDDQYDEAIEAANRGLERFPQNARLNYIKGFAHHGRGELHEAVVSLKRFLALAPNDPGAPSVRQMVADDEQRFLTTWYTQANFYQSNDARIVAFNAQANRADVTFQVTPEYELQLGQMGFTQLAQGARAVSDPETTAFLQQLVNRIVERTPGPAFRYDVTLLDSPDVNAVTPPGHIIVYTGLLRFVENEGQLVGVLSHELAHNYAHHSARRVIKAYYAQSVAAAVTQAVNPQSATAQIMTQLSTSVGIGLFLNAYSRFEEKEADLFGSHLMFNAGYNPTGLPSAFLKLYEANPKQAIKFLNTHPPLPDRVNYLSDYLEAFPLDRPLLADSSDAFASLKRRYPSASAVPQIGPVPR
jgi:predicted Zn-dependent protease